MSKNECIGCTVSECKHYNNQYCSLNKIQVVKHGGCASEVEHTDCGNFIPK